MPQNAWQHKTEQGIRKATRKKTESQNDYHSFLHDVKVRSTVLVDSSTWITNKHKAAAEYLDCGPKYLENALDELTRCEEKGEEVKD